MSINFNKIFKKNKKWVQDKLAYDPTYFARLAKGQWPEVLYIGCSDSRVTAEELMGAEPGEVFVHRNIANQVIPTDNNVNAVIQYAVEFMQVKHIVVCGHYNCGGVQAALNPNDMGQLNAWLQTLRNVYRLHFKEIESIKDTTLRFNRLVELNVREQCINILKTDHVQKSWHKYGYPQVHGWVFDIHTGKIIDLKLSIKKEFAQILNIFDLRLGEDKLGNNDTQFFI
jgi:carbonic anhydrase